MAEQKKYDFDRVVRMVLTLISVGVGVWLVNYLSPVLMPFVVGFILAYLIEPLVEWLQREREHVLRIDGYRIFSTSVSRLMLYAFIAFLIFYFAGQVQTFIYFQF